MQQTPTLERSRNAYGFTVGADGMAARVALTKLQHVALEVSKRFHGW
jgi:hypothetical protein